MSSSILRKAVVHEDVPAVIENTFDVSYAAYSQPQAALVEELLDEYPDTPPEDIEAAISEAMDQLRADAPGGDLDGAEFPGMEAEPGFGDLGEGDDGADFLAVDEAAPSVPVLEDAAQPPAPVPGAMPSEILEEARREAQQVLAEADQRAAEIERAAYSKGYEEGLAAGRADGEQQSVEMLRQMAAIIDQATELHDTMLHEAETEMVALCLEIARKVVHTELRTNPDVVAGVVSDAVAKINGSPRVTIKVHPTQVDDLRTHWDEAFGPNYREKEWIIEGDDSVEPGGCVLETKYGSLDARIGTQFEQLQKTFALLLGTDEQHAD
ncbi:MAG TPA: type III secretion system stator protein SctL [Chloroflexota bacterium]|nr:type III secretion system stator protein SctL [Chloroflexota bacterium]